LIVLTLASLILICVNIVEAQPFAYVANQGGNTVSVIDTVTNEVVDTVNIGSLPTGVAVTPDGTRAYVTNYVRDGTVSVIDTATNTIAATVTGLSSPYVDVVTPDGTKVYVASWVNNTVSVIDTETNTITATVNIPGNPFGVAVTPDGTKVYLANYGANNVSVINTTNNSIYASVTGLSGPINIAVTPDGTKAYVTNQNGNTASVIDTATNQIIATVNVGMNPHGVAVTPDGTKAYVTNYVRDGIVYVIDTATNQVIATVNVGSYPNEVAVSPNGQNVYVANYYSYTVSVINTTNNTTYATIDVGQEPWGIVISPAAIEIAIPITPKITWSNPANITYGTVLNSTQLDATASVPGNFVYNPAAGTVLSVGPHILNTTFTPNDTANYSTVRKSVSINVTQATPTIIWNNPANINYGTPLSSIWLDATASVPGSFVYNPIAGTVLDVGTYTLNATFTPTDTANYTTATASVSLNVTKITPTITWNNPADIVYGTKLNVTQLDATSSESGTFAYNSPLGTKLGAGQHQQLNTIFTPTSVNDSVFINVIRATPTITWSNPAGIVYGTKLSSTQLDAKASVPGTFVYTNATGTVETIGSVLSAGTQTLTATLTPNDTVNYTLASKTVPITVTKATPVFTWDKTVDIVSGTPLSTQLDVTASNPVSGAPVSGIFNGVPSTGTILGTGTHKVTGSFTPTDTANYTTLSATASINIK
jgi:YVTN family beta-propeller protein